MRLDKFLSNKQLGSRKDIKAMIKEGLVSVNHHILRDPQYAVQSKDHVTLRDVTINHHDTVVLMMNKPKGYVCANQDNLHPSVFEWIKPPYIAYDLNIVGRLDIDTEGLLLLTNDGAYIHHMTSPKKNVFKTYYVKTNIPFIDLNRLLQPFEIKDGHDVLYQPMTPIVKYIDEDSFYLSIQEGKHHQVKRMIAYFGYEVTYLKRTQIGDIVLDESLKPGSYKLLEIDF